jgi:hypothetical protein
MAQAQRPANGRLLGFLGGAGIKAGEWKVFGFWVAQAFKACE